MNRLPRIGDNRTVLIGIIASAIPVTVLFWGISHFVGVPGTGDTAGTNGIDAKDIAIVLNAIGVPLSFLLGRQSGENKDS